MCIHVCMCMYDCACVLARERHVQEEIQYVYLHTCLIYHNLGARHIKFGAKWQETLKLLHLYGNLAIVVTTPTTQ